MVGEWHSSKWDLKSFLILKVLKKINELYNKLCDTIVCNEEVTDKDEVPEFIEKKIKSA